METVEENQTKMQKTRVNDTAGEAIKILMEFCINEKIINPKIIMDATTTDGEHYRLIFERTDLDKTNDEIK